MGNLQIILLGIFVPILTAASIWKFLDSDWIWRRMQKMREKQKSQNAV